MDFYRYGLKLTGDAHRAGVTILAGTDANDTYVFPGFSLHDELAELVQAGFTPLAALQAATLHAARYLKESADFGSVETGKVADVVLLDADPLIDIGHTRRIKAVLYNGKLYTRNKLDTLLAEAEQRAERSWEPHDHSPAQVALWNAVIVGDVTKVRSAIQAGADVNGLDTRPETAGPNARRALHYAAWRNDTEMIGALIEAGADLNATNHAAFMPLHYAAQTGSTEAASLLIASGASLSHQNSEGRTPLEMATSHLHGETAAVIREAMSQAQ